MLKDLEYLYRYMIQRTASAHVSKSDDYTEGYRDAMDEVLSALAELIEEYRTEYHDDE